MTSEQANPPAPHDHVDPNPVWVERTGARTYLGHNARGAQVEIGSRDHDGVFSPGELLKLAVAACNTLSAERSVLKRVGGDGPITAGVTSTKAQGKNRYSTLLVELVLPIAELPEDVREEAIVAARRAVAMHCTVGRTIEAAADIELIVSDEA